MKTGAEIRAQGRIAGFILIGLLLVALGLRLWGMGFGLPQKVHPDESLLADRAIEAASKGQFNPGFYHWPNFIIYLLYFEYLLTYLLGFIAGAYSGAIDLFESYFTNPTFYFWLGRITTTLFCLGGMAVIYLIGKKVAGRGAGLAAAALLGFDALFIEHSRYITPDIPAVCLMIYVWYCLLDYIDSGKIRMLYSAAFIGGVAMSTKYNAGLILVPIIIAAVTKVQHWPSGDIPALSRRIGKYILICLLLFAVGFVIFTPYCILDANEFQQQLKQQFHHQSIGHIGMETGTSALSAAGEYFFSPYGLALLVLALAGLPMLNVRRGYRLILLSFPVLYLIILSGWVVWAERYLLFILPVCFIAAGASLSRIGDFLGKTLPTRRTELMVLALSILLVMPSLVSAVRHASVISRTDTRVASLHWIEENIHPRSRLFIEKGGPEPHHVDDIEQFGLNVSPVYYYTEPKLWLSIENEFDEPLVILRRLVPKPQYIISSGYTRDRYFKRETQARHQEIVKPWIEYYTFIDTHCELLQEFTPDDNHTGPWIKIYKLPEGLLD